MESSMSRSIHEEKIIRAVIISIKISMMNDLVIV